MTKTWKYLLIIVAGCAIGMLATGLDARLRFVPERAVLRTIAIWENLPGWMLPAVERVYPPKPVRVEVEPGVNLLLDPQDLVARQILITGTWQSRVWQSISAGLPAGGVFLDVGAHIGYDTLKASVTVGPSGKVIAFEPNPGTLEQLRANIDASHATNVIVAPIACADKEQVLTLYDSTSQGNSGASSLSLENADEDGKGTLPSYSVRARRIDDVVRELGLTRLDVIKVDTEGAEVLVIRGRRRR